MGKHHHIKTAVLIGAGNVATHLGKALVRKGITVVQVYSPTGESAKVLAKKLKAKHTDDIKAIDTKVDIIIVSVKDNALPTLAKKMKFGNVLTVHTSGTLPINALAKCSTNYGVFYPFQTFNKEVKVKFSQVPVCIDANSIDSLKSLEGLAEVLVKKHYLLNGEQRQWLHIMGVFSSNFTNLMFRIVKELADGHNIPFDIVHPLIAQTVEKIKTHNPADVQTGPASRGDVEVMNKHLEKLAGKKTYQSIYQLLSKSIPKTN